jgi:hypothetical protein
LRAPPELQARHGKKYCDEAELLPLLLAPQAAKRTYRNIFGFAPKIATIDQ